MKVCSPKPTASNWWSTACANWNAFILGAAWCFLSCLSCSSFCLCFHMCFLRRARHFGRAFAVPLSSAAALSLATAGNTQQQRCVWKGWVVEGVCLQVWLSVCWFVCLCVCHQHYPPSTLPQWVQPCVCQGYPPINVTPIKVTPHQCCNTCCKSLTVALQKSNFCMCKSLSNDAPTPVGAALAVQKSNFCMCNSQTFACAKVATVACAKVCCCTATVGATH